MSGSGSVYKLCVMDNMQLSSLLIIIKFGTCAVHCACFKRCYICYTMQYLLLTVNRILFSLQSLSVDQSILKLQNLLVPKTWKRDCVCLGVCLVVFFTENLTLNIILVRTLRKMAAELTLSCRPFITILDFSWRPSWFVCSFLLWLLSLSLS